MAQIAAATANDATSFTDLMTSLLSLTKSGMYALGGTRVENC